MTDIYIAPPPPAQSSAPAAPPPPAVSPAPSPSPSSAPAPAQSSDGTSASGSAAPYVQPPKAPLMSVPRLSSSAQLTLIPSLLGKPGLDDTLGMSPEVLKAVLSLFNSKFGDEQIKAGNNSIEMVAKKRADANEVAEKRLDDMIKSAAEALKNSATSDALKWVTRVLVPALAVLAVPLTLGAAAPVVVFVAAMSAYSLAQFASDEAGGPSLSLADQVGKGLGKLIQMANPGMSDKDAEQAGMVASAVVAVVAAVAMRSGGGVGGLTGAAKGAALGMKSAQGAAQTAQAGMQMAKVGAQAALPALVAMDGKFIGNVAGGATYLIANEAGDMSEEDAAQIAAIVGMAVTMATQMAVGLGLARQGGNLSDTLKLSANAAKIANNMGLVQDGLTVANGANSAASGGVKVETTLLEYTADMDKLEVQRSDIERGELNDMHTLFLSMVKGAVDLQDANFASLAEIERDDQRANQQIISHMRAEA